MIPSKTYFLKIIKSFKNIATFKIPFKVVQLVFIISYRVFILLIIPCDIARLFYFFVLRAKGFELVGTARVPYIMSWVLFHEGFFF